MRHQLTYTTSIEIDGGTLHDHHIIICSSWEHAKAIEYDLMHGDFGDIKAYAIDIEPILETMNDDLPF
jgi:hypothetical protein